MAVSEKTAGVISGGLTVERNGFPGRSAIRVGLVVSCAACLLCIAFELFCLGCDLPLLLHADVVEQTEGLLQPLIAGIAVRDVLQAAAGALYCLFVFKAWDGELFCNVQVRRLLLVAILVLAAVVVSMLCVNILPGIEEQEAIFLTSPALQADPMQLAFSFMLFALAGVFKYGCALQEDCDAIL